MVGPGLLGLLQGWPELVPVLMGLEVLPGRGLPWEWVPGQEPVASWAVV